MRFKTSPGSRSSLSINSARLRPYLQLATTTKPSTADATHLLKLVRQMARTGRWEIFALPFCSRCTPVVVAAVQDILKAATENALLRNRLSKPFECFMPDKEQDGQNYPNINVAACSVDRPGAHMPARYVLGVVSKIPEEDIAESYEGFGYPTVLLIGPSNFTEPVVQALKQAGYPVSRRDEPQPDIAILDGYLILRDEQYSRIGWRIVMECVPPPQKMRSLVKPYFKLPIFVSCSTSSTSPG